MASVLGLPIAAHGSIDSVGGRRASRFSRKVLPRMLGVVDHARPLRTSPLRCNGFCLRSPERPRHLGQSPFRGSVPGLRVPLSTLRARPLGRVHMTRGHRGWLALQCANPSFAALCRFIPALLWTELAIQRSTSFRTPSERKRLGARAESGGGRHRPVPAVGQLPHHRRSIRTGRKLRQELLDLAPRLVGGPLQDVLPVLQVQVRRQLRAR
jgi:hypothetical protein